LGKIRRSKQTSKRSGKISQEIKASDPYRLPETPGKEPSQPVEEVTVARLGLHQREGAEDEIHSQGVEDE